MRKVIMVAGCVAAGKSSFAQRLSLALAIPCFMKDTIKETLAASVHTSTYEENQELSHAAFGMLCYAAAAHLAAGSDVLLESNFRPHEAQSLRQLIAASGGRSLSFVLAGDMRTLYQRFIARDASPERDPIHKSHGTPAFESFAGSQAAMAVFDAGGERIVVDTTDFSLVPYEALIERAALFLRS